MAALVVFLAVGKWMNPLKYLEIPKHLGINIQQEANGFTYTQARGGRTLFKIHASKVVQLKQGNAHLHDVKIELYGEDGKSVDRIEGSEFEYDQAKGTAIAAGPVEITLMRPGVAPVIAPKANTALVAGSKPLAAAAETAARGEIRVKTSGLTFDRKNGTATTAQHVDFSTIEGSGSSTGATYDSEKGLLVLDRDVKLTSQHRADPVQIQARHAEFLRDDQICRLSQASADYKGGQAGAVEARLHFRDDGSVERLEATNGFQLTTASGAHLAAPTGQMEFNAQNQPRHGHLEGGVTMDSISQKANDHQQLHGSAPTAELEFSAQGELRHAHLERGVQLHSDAVRSSASDGKAGGALRKSRNWQSAVADLQFRPNSAGRLEPESVHGTGGVVIASETQRGNGKVVPSRLAADEVTGIMNTPKGMKDGLSLQTLTGVGHASIDETALNGVRQTSSGDRLEVHFKPDATGTNQIERANLEGHVVLTHYPVAKPGAKAAADPIRMTSGHADFVGADQMLHLTVNPRVENGGLSLTANRIDLSQGTGDAFAHGNVKASWIATSAGTTKAGSPEGALFGGKAPSHVVADEAQVSQGGEATFRGKARLWQQANSIAAPVILLSRDHQTLTAHSASASEPVRVVMLSNAETASQNSERAPTVIRVRGGEFLYAETDRKALMRSGTLGPVVEETATATTSSDEVEVVLRPARDRSGAALPARVPTASEIDHLTARGHVLLRSQGRRGSGEQLVYTSQTDAYVLTGTSSLPPRASDPVRGSVTGKVLIFHGGDQSVLIEGGEGKTTTQTTAPK